MKGLARNVFLLLTSTRLVFSLARASGGGDDAHHHEHAPAVHHQDTHHQEHGALHDPAAGNMSHYMADMTFTLRTALVEEGMAFVGVGGDIEGVINPKLEVPHGAVVEITLVNGDGIEHDVAIPVFDVMAEHIAVVGEKSVVAFEASEEGTFEYRCALPGHVTAGMKGLLEVTEHHH
ncbi:MAG: cupredoxin domain-containing protein [Trueperaceae bacterium]|nr:MAG: cupredoxin domain-containing protein [Trueperaceae bacterium]